jgi:hypothetical protein
MAACGSIAKPAPIDNRATATAPFWSVLERGTWHLQDGAHTLTCEGRGMRDERAAHVYAFDCGAAATPHAIAIHDGHVWVVRAGDDGTSGALAEPPFGVDPPARSGGSATRYMRIESVKGERVVCVGEGPGENAGPCEEGVCFGELCVGERSGLVRVEGLWAPDREMFFARGFSD